MEDLHKNFEGIQEARPGAVEELIAVRKVHAARLNGPLAVAVASDGSLLIADTENDRVRQVLLDPAAPDTAQELALLGVTAIGIHPGAHVDSEAPPHDPARSNGYKLIARFPDGASIWQVVAEEEARRSFCL